MSARRPSGTPAPPASVRGRSTAPGSVAASEPPPQRPLEPITWLVLAGGALFVLTFVAIALLRIGYPFELEWMEGSMVAHIARVVAGQPLYVSPTLAFTPFAYPPLYFEVSALFARILGVGFVPLRLVSLLSSLGCMALIFLIVRRGSTSPWPGVAAACLFAASFRQGGAWFDVGRVDMLSHVLVLAAFFALRTDPSWWRGGLAGGVLLALATLTKQSALFVAPFLAAGLLIADWRRSLAFGAALAVVGGGAAAWLDFHSSGWFRFYVLEVPRAHPIIGQLLRGFWLDDLLGPVGLALAIGTVHFFVGSGPQRARLLCIDGAFVIGLIVTAWVLRVHVGSYENVLIPAYLAVSLVFGLGLDDLFELRAVADPVRARHVERFVAFLCVAQFLALLYKPWREVPRPRDLEAGKQLVESLRHVPGDVWIPSHPYLAELAGKRGHAHELAMVDVMRQGETPLHRTLIDSLRTALREHQYALVVLDGDGWTKDETQQAYELKARMFGDNEPHLFWPETGFHTRPDLVWTPSVKATESPPPSPRTGSR
jgi:hypothetical protein